MVRVGSGAVLFSATTGVEETVLKVIFIWPQRERFTRELGSGGIGCVVVLHDEIVGLSLMVDFHDVTLTTTVSVFSRGGKGVRINSHRIVPVRRLFASGKRTLVRTTRATALAP